MNTGRNIFQRIKRIYARYHHPRFLRMDPLGWVRRFATPPDREIAGVLAAVLAYGRVGQILRTLDAVSSITGPKLHDFAGGTSFMEKLRLFGSLKHRFNDGVDLALTLEISAIALQEHGSMEQLFAQGMRDFHKTVKEPLHFFTEFFRRKALKLGRHDRKSFHYLFASPRSGSACKRLNMFLRWMVRSDDGIDLGIWKSVSSSKLIIPVDTHVARIATELGMTSRKSPDWSMAEEITHFLKKIAPQDPVKYDFSLCRAGMSGVDRSLLPGGE